MENENVSKYLEITSQKRAIEDLLADIETAQQGYLPIWSTGFTELDDKLDGGFLGGNLILMGAISSLGKTTFALQIAENIASAGKDVIIFSLEMSKNELNAKSISRNTFKLTDDEKDTEKKTRQKYRLTMGDILRGRVGKIGDEKRKLFDEALAQTESVNDHLYIIRDNKITVDNIGEIVETHIQARPSSRPFVVIDYLQILKPSESTKSNDKRLLTDEDVNNLKDLAVRLGIPILVISAFNRASYLDPVSMGSFKESGNIEYSGDTLIGLQYSGMQYMKHWYTNKNGSKKKVYESKIEHDTRVRELAEKMDKDGADGNFLPIDVVLLKNRGVSKGKILFEFCPKYNIFREKNDQSVELYEWDHDADEDYSDAGLSSVVSSNTDVKIGGTVK